MLFRSEDELPRRLDVPLTAEYLEAARELILAAFRAQTRHNGLLELVFSRVYVLARKP